MYILYKSPAAFYQCLITVVITFLRTTATQKEFSVLRPETLLLTLSVFSFSTLVWLQEFFESVQNEFQMHL